MSTFKIREISEIALLEHLSPSAGPLSFPALFQEVNFNSPLLLL